MRFWLCFHGFSWLYLAIVFMQSSWNTVVAFLSLAEKTQMQKAMQLSSQRHISDSVVFICTSLTESDLSCPVWGSTVCLPALWYKWSLLSLHWNEETSMCRPCIESQLISCLAAEAPAGVVYKLRLSGYYSACVARLSGCSSTAAAGLQLSSCRFFSFPHVWVSPAAWKNAKNEKMREPLIVKNVLYFKW